MEQPVSSEISQNDGNKRDSDPKWAVKRFETRKDTDSALREESIEGFDGSIAPEGNEWNYWTIFYSLLIVIACLFSSFGATLVPQHNSLVQPEYWYEFIIAHGLGINAYFVIMAALRMQIFFKDDFSLESPIPFMKMYLAILLGHNGTSYIFYQIWTVYFGFNHPMPWLGYCALLGFVPAYFISLWYAFPVELRSNTQGREKIVNFLG